MKKLKLIAASFVVGCAAVATVLISQSQSNATSSLIAQNIEALTYGEDDYIRDEYGCIIWHTVCYGVIVTPIGNHQLNVEGRRN